jgi:hypothetical protein
MCIRLRLGDPDDDADLVEAQFPLGERILEMR